VAGTTRVHATVHFTAQMPPKSFTLPFPVDMSGLESVASPVKTAQGATPPFVSIIIASSASSNINIGLLREDCNRVVKFHRPGDDEGAKAIAREKRILDLLGPHHFIAPLHWADERGLCFDFYALGSVREFCLAFRHTPPHVDYHTCGIKVSNFGLSTLVGEECVGPPSDVRYTRQRLDDKADTPLNSTYLDDIFALGSLYYELLLGKPPYHDLEPSEVINNYRARVFPALDEVQPTIFANIISKCWNEKYETAADVVKDTPSHDEVLDMCPI
jgi:hypothetical protein